MADKTISLDGNNQAISGFRPPTGNVIYPFRTSDDTVMKEFWKTLPVATKDTAKYYKVDNWDMVSELTSQLLSQGFDPQTMTWGNGKVGSSLKAWTGMAYDPRTKKSYHARGGGHADTTLNAVYEHDFLKLKAILLDMPTDPNNPSDVWPDNYKNIQGQFTCGIGFNDVDDFSVNPQTITSYTTYMDSNGCFHEDMPSDGRPASLHYYNGTGKLGDWVWTTRNRKFSYNIKTGQYKTEHWTKDGQSYIPSINNDLIYHEGTDTYFGKFSKKNSEFDFSKLTSDDALDIKSVGLPSGTATSAETVIFPKDKDSLILFKPSTNTVGAFVCEFNVLTGTWGEKRIIPNPTGNTRAWYEQEMIPAIFLPNWGTKGSILFHFTWSGNGDDGEPLARGWWLIDYDTLQMQRFTVADWPDEHGEHTGNKHVIIDMYGMSFAVYMWVRDELSDLYIMRIK